MRKAVLLVNLGSPDAPSVPSVRRYLREFLMDGRVLDVNWVARFCIVHLAILPWRPKHSAEAYKKVWTAAGSPLVATSRNVLAALRKRVTVPVELAMRYQHPSIPEAVHALVRQGAEEVLLIPLFPHYAMSSYETAVERVKEVARRLAPQMRLEIQPPYYDQPDYIAALAGKRGRVSEERVRPLALQLSRAAGAAPPQVRPDGMPLPGGRELLREAQPGPCHMLPGAVLQDRRRVCRQGRGARRQILRRLSVAPGPGPVAEALHRSRPGRNAGTRDQTARRHLPCLRVGLPRKRWRKWACAGVRPFSKPVARNSRSFPA